MTIPTRDTTVPAPKEPNEGGSAQTAEAEPSAELQVPAAVESIEGPEASEVVRTDGQSPDPIDRLEAEIARLLGRQPETETP